LGLKARLFGDSCEDGGSEFLGIVERERIICPAILFQDFVGAYCTVMAPPKPLQGSEHSDELLPKARNSRGNVERCIGRIRGQFAMSDPVENYLSRG
jgi:hypothetical protein